MVINLDIGKSKVPPLKAVPQALWGLTQWDLRGLSQTSVENRMLLKERENTFLKWRKESLYFKGEECLGKEVLLSWRKYYWDKWCTTETQVRVMLLKVARGKLISKKCGVTSVLSILWAKQNVLRDFFDNYLLACVRAISKYSHERHPI